MIYYEKRSYFATTEFIIYLLRIQRYINFSRMKRFPISLFFRN